MIRNRHKYNSLKIDVYIYIILANIIYLAQFKKYLLCCFFLSSSQHKQNTDTTTITVIKVPIYMEKPLNSILDFLQNSRDMLQEKKVILFAVGLATFRFAASS